MLKSIDDARIFPTQDPHFVNPNYIEGHYGRYPNVLAHLRLQDVADPETGGKILRIEEIQSDWSQKGRKVGFKMTPEEIADAKQKFVQLEERGAKIMDEAQKVYSVNGPGPEYNALYQQAEKLADQKANLQKAIKANERGKAYPSNPYVKDTERWTELAVKRALKEAADNPEYEKMQLTAGSMQFERWGETKEAEGVAKFYDTKLKGTLEKMIKRLDPEAKVERRTGENLGHDTKLENMADELELDLQHINDERIDLRDRLDELHRRMAESTEPVERRRIQEMMNDVARDIDELDELRIQRYADYDEASAELINAGPTDDFYEVTITPKLREAISKGLPRYERGGKVVYNPPKVSETNLVQRALALAGGRPVNS